MDIDIINISETSHRLNDKFKSNISIEGYKFPFTTGSKFSKGGVVIYVKDNLNTTERDDLIEISDSIEAIWIEMEKTKNIICGFVYKHPNTDRELYFKLFTVN